jgi:nicotinamidase-related amidase
VTALEFSSGDVLLVVDVINAFDHDDADSLFASFEERLPALTDVIAAARAAGLPIVYVNDERGGWTSDARGLIEAVRSTPRGSHVLDRVAPQAGDHVLLKHRYSAFDHTALDLLLRELDVDRLLLVGAATEGCVVQTAIDAREQGIKTTIVADACASTDASLEAIALNYAERVVGARVIRLSSLEPVAEEALDPMGA